MNGQSVEGAYAPSTPTSPYPVELCAALPRQVRIGRNTKRDGIQPPRFSVR